MYKIGVIGLGYIGLPLAVEFGKYFNVVGYDKNETRIKDLKRSIDYSNELSSKYINSSKKLTFTLNSNDLKRCNFFIIAVPTPIYSNKKPDLRLIKEAIKIVSKFLKKKDFVIFESTFYPGATEEYCVPLLEKYSKLKLNKDFFVGYCPERINPGDKKNSLTNINKLVSGSNKYSLKIIKNLYMQIIKAKVFDTSSIKIAEAAKIIENTQRDVNIALMNEISKIFNKLNIDTNEVLDAASTKWNFLPFKPGLVGGHCISVDPHYLSFISEVNKVDSKIIKTSRLINNSVPKYIVRNLINQIKNKKNYQDIKILIMGITFKENCSDIRNSKSLEIYQLLIKKKFRIDIYDPNVNKINNNFNNLKIIKKPKQNYYDVILITVKHDIFKKIGINKIKKYGKTQSLIYDLKSLFDKKYSDFRL